MQDVESLLAAIVRDLPVFRNMPGKPVITRVGGLSNRTYRIDTAQGSFALRVPQTDSGPFVNRLHEIEATGMASEIGVGADLIHAQENGVMLTRWVEDARPSCPMIYRSDPHAIDRVARAIATLHRSGREFKGQFDLVNVLDIYRARLAFRGQMSWYGPLETTVDAACRSLAGSMGDL